MDAKVSHQNIALLMVIVIYFALELCHENVYRELIKKKSTNRYFLITFNIATLKTRRM